MIALISHLDATTEVRRQQRKKERKKERKIVLLVDQDLCTPVVHWSSVQLGMYTQGDHIERIRMRLGIEK